MSREGRSQGKGESLEEASESRVKCYGRSMRVRTKKKQLNLVIKK